MSMCKFQCLMIGWRVCVRDDGAFFSSFQWYHFPSPRTRNSLVLEYVHLQPAHHKPSFLHQSWMHIFFALLLYSLIQTMRKLLSLPWWERESRIDTESALSPSELFLIRKALNREWVPTTGVTLRLVSQWDCGTHNHFIGEGNLHWLQTQQMIVIAPPKTLTNALGLFSKTKLQSTYEIMISVLSCQICEVGGLVVIHKRT